jgi:hypothetical protein
MKQLPTFNSLYVAINERLNLSTVETFTILDIKFNLNPLHSNYDLNLFFEYTQKTQLSKIVDDLNQDFTKLNSKLLSSIFYNIYQSSYLELINSYIKQVTFFDQFYYLQTPKTRIKIEQNKAQIIKSEDITESKLINKINLISYLRLNRALRLLELNPKLSQYLNPDLINLLNKKEDIEIFKVIDL